MFSVLEIFKLSVAVKVIHVHVVPIRGTRVHNYVYSQNVNGILQLVLLSKSDCC